jgi:hypothetical protein
MNLLTGLVLEEAGDKVSKISSNEAKARHEEF